MNICYILTPQMMNNIQVADLREEPAHCFIVFLSVFDCPRPVVRHVILRGVIISRLLQYLIFTLGKVQATDIINLFKAT